MKETYPVPGLKKKPPAPSIRKEFPEVPANAHPNECLGTDQSRWEEAVFRHAAYFTVIKKNRPAGAPTLKGVRFWRKEFKTFPEAVAEAGGTPQVLVYAITAEGRAVCLPPKEWDKYRKIWEEQHKD